MPTDPHDPQQSVTDKRGTCQASETSKAVSPPSNKKLIERLKDHAERARAAALGAGSIEQAGAANQVTEDLRKAASALEEREGLEAEAVAKRFHDAYERLSPSYGYKTRDASAVPWEDVPEQNKMLMIATVEAALNPPPIEKAG